MPTPAVTLAEAKEQLAAYLSAEIAVLKNQAYTIKDRSFRKADLKEIREGVRYWMGQVNGKEKGDNAELALLEYIHNTRKPTRSYTHFNNWYTLEAKEITVDNTIKKVFLPMMRNLARYGAKLDAICPDNGWQKTKGYSRIFEAKIDEKLVLDVYLTVDVEVDDQACPVEPNLPAQVSQNYRRLNQHLIHCKMNVNQHVKN